MKRISLIITMTLFLASTVCTGGVGWAQTIARMNVTTVGGGVTAVAGNTYVFSESFDGATACGDGATSTCNNTWTKEGTPTMAFNYATSPAPLEGTYSARHATASANSDGYYISFTEQTSTIYGYLIINHATLKGGNAVFELRDGSDITLFNISNANPEFRIYCGSLNDYSTTITQGTTYHVWFDYTKGTGSNAVCHLYHATTATKPESPNISITSGDATGNPSKIFLIPTMADSVTIYDKIRLSTSNIGSNPD